MAWAEMLHPDTIIKIASAFPALDDKRHIALSEGEIGWNPLRLNERPVSL